MDFEAVLCADISRPAFSNFQKQRHTISANDCETERGSKQEKGVSKSVCIVSQRVKEAQNVQGQAVVREQMQGGPSRRERLPIDRAHVRQRCTLTRGRALLPTIAFSALAARIPPFELRL